MLTEIDVWNSDGIMAANYEAGIEMRLLMKLVSAIEAEVMAIWDSGTALQIDSYAMGRPQAGVAHLMADYIHLEVTDGISTFRGKIPLPKNWGLAAAQGERK